MDIEKVIILSTLKSGKKIWEEGTVLVPPLPPDIQEEVDLGVKTIKVIYHRKSRRLPSQVKQDD